MSYIVFNRKCGGEWTPLSIHTDHKAANAALASALDQDFEDCKRQDFKAEDYAIKDCLVEHLTDMKTIEVTGDSPGSKTWNESRGKVNEEWCDWIDDKADELCGTDEYGSEWYYENTRKCVTGDTAVFPVGAQTSIEGYIEDLECDNEYKIEYIKFQYGKVAPYILCTGVIECRDAQAHDLAFDGIVDPIGVYWSFEKAEKEMKKWLMADFERHKEYDDIEIDMDVVEETIYDELMVKKVMDMKGIDISPMNPTEKVALCAEWDTEITDEAKRLAGELPETYALDKVEKEIKEFKAEEDEMYSVMDFFDPRSIVVQAYSIVRKTVE